MNTAEALFRNIYFQVILFLLASAVLFFMGEKIVNIFLKKKKIQELHFVRDTRLLYHVLRLVIIFALLSANQLFISDALWKPILEKLALTILIITVFFLVLSVVRFFYNRALTSTFLRRFKEIRQRNLLNVLTKFTNITLLIIAVTVALNIWGVQIGPILTGLGIAGLAIGLALQDTLANIFGGISLSLDDAYREDEVVELSSGEAGVIHSIGYRSTKIKTYKEEIIIVPNSRMAQMNIRNISRPGNLSRVELIVSAAYGSGLDHVKFILNQICRSTDGVLEFPDPEVWFIKMGEYSLDFKVLVFVASPADRMPVSDRLLTAIYETFRSENINIPYPTRTLIVQEPVSSLKPLKIPARKNKGL